MISQEEKFQNISTTNIYFNINFKNILFIGCGVLFGLISLLPLTTNTEYFLLELLQEILFLLLGIAYIFSLKKNISTNSNFNKKMYPVYLTLVYCVALTVIYFLYRKELWLMAISSSAAFILPFCINVGWKYFLAIPDKQYHVWVPQKINNNIASLFLDSIFIKIKIAKNVDDMSDSTYAVHAPHYIKLGDFFSRFINNQKQNKDTEIEEFDSLNDRYAWEFFITDLYGLQMRRLDPYLTLADNKIKQGNIINIRRLIQPAKLLAYTTKNLLNESGK